MRSPSAASAWISRAIQPKLVASLVEPEPSVILLDDPCATAKVDRRAPLGIAGGWSRHKHPPKRWIVAVCREREIDIWRKSGSSSTSRRPSLSTKILCRVCLAGGCEPGSAPLARLGRLPRRGGGGCAALSAFSSGSSDSGAEAVPGWPGTPRDSLPDLRVLFPLLFPSPSRLRTSLGRSPVRSSSLRSAASARSAFATAIRSENER